MFQVLSPQTGFSGFEAFAGAPGMCIAEFGSSDPVDRPIGELPVRVDCGDVDAAD